MPFAPGAPPPSAAVARVMRASASSRCANDAKTAVLPPPPPAAPKVPLSGANSPPPRALTLMALGIRWKRGSRQGSTLVIDPSGSFVYAAAWLDASKQRWRVETCSTPWRRPCAKWSAAKRAEKGLVHANLEALLKVGGAWREQPALVKQCGASLREVSLKQPLDAVESHAVL